MRGGATTWSFTRSCKTHSSRAACPSSSASTTCRRPGSSTAGPTPSQACARGRAARSAPGQSCCHSRIGWSNPVATAGLGGAILLPQQDWVEQSCCHSSDAVLAASLPECFFHHSHAQLFKLRRGRRIAHSILAWQQDCPKNPSPGQRRRSVSDAVLAVSLTECFFTTHTPCRQSWLPDLRRWPGDGFFGMKPNSGSDALPVASLPQDFSGKIGS